MNTFINVLKWTTLSLVLIGAINWGLIGAFNFDLVSSIFGEMSVMSRVIYSIVGLSAIGYLIFALMERNEERSCFN